MPLSHWLKRRLPKRGDLDRLLDRYLRAFGPATAADFAAWSGLAVGPVNERYTREHSTPRTRPSPTLTPAPVRFLPAYDNALLAHVDRSRILPAGIKSSGLIGRPTVLVDGFVTATWKLSDGEIAISPLAKPKASERREVKAEAQELARLLAAKRVLL
jgi:hypothetical protein